VVNILDRCWSTIGVWSQQPPRCEKLKEVVHCRNCRTYWDAGRQILDKGIPDGYLEQWTAILANNPEQHLLTDRSGIYFRLYDEWFSLPTRYFVEVSPIKYFHVVPHVRSKLIHGLINIGGAVHLCFSLSGLLNLQHKIKSLRDVKDKAYKRLVLVKINSQEFVFPVDEIGGVYHYSQSDIENVPESYPSEIKSFLSGILQIDNITVACLDAQRLAQGFEGFSNE